MRKLTVSIILLFMFLITCDILESEKEIKENKTTHPTEYSWTIDTLIIKREVPIRFNPEDILYNDTNDIYVVGDDQIRYYNVYFHYNGKEWREHKIWSLDKAYSICKIENTIYLVGGDTETNNEGEEEFVPRIVKYNESEWVEELTVIKENNKSGRSRFIDIWGHQQNDIWACGLDGLIYHYNGHEWEDYSMADTIWIKSISGNSFGDLYAIGYYRSDSDIIRYLLKWNGKEWGIEEKFFSYKYDYRFYPFGTTDIYVSDEYIYSCGYGVFKKRPKDNEWRKLFQHESAAYYDISGSGPDNIYTVGQWGVANYYDGENWFVLDSVYQNRDLIYTKTWTDGNQAFIIGYDYNHRAYVLHGK